MDSGGLEDVCILAVDSNCECVCLGSKRNSFTVDKGKEPVNLSRRAFTKKIGKAKTEAMSQESPVIILDDSSGSETDYIEIGCCQPPLIDTAVSDSSAFPDTQYLFKSPAVCDTIGPQTGNEFSPQTLTGSNNLNLSNLQETPLNDDTECLPPLAKKLQQTPPSNGECLFTNTYSNNTCSDGNCTKNNVDTMCAYINTENMETDMSCHQHASPQLSNNTAPSDETPLPQLMPTTSISCTVPTSTQLLRAETDFELAMRLNQELNHKRKEDEKLLKMDEEIAKKLQQEEYLKGMNSSKHGDERLARNLMVDELNAYTMKQESDQKPLNHQSNSETEVTGSATNSMCNSASDSSVSSSNSSSSLGVNKSSSSDQLKRYPTCWTSCPNCEPDTPRKYHLIDVESQSAEWEVVTLSLTRVNFHVTRVQRIQNEALWQRLCFEKQLMLRERDDVNEQLLYHTSRAEKAVICEEGLDPRLSRNGYFGVGMYFSDDPVKCNNYWSPRHGSGHLRRMFCCRVLLGHVKHYARGKSERLVREPPKENPRHGEPKTYDSVQGNITGQNEFVVYNAYRVMPEYVIEYYLTPVTSLPPVPVFAGPANATFQINTLVFHQTSKPVNRVKGCKRKGTRKRK